MALHLAHREAPGIEGQYLLIEARQPALVLGDELGLEGAGPVARNGDRHRPGVGEHGLGTGPIAVIAPARARIRGEGTLGLLGQVMPQLGPERPLGQRLLQLGKETLRPQDVLGPLTAGQQLIE